MGFLKKLLAVLLTFINLIALKIYENEILEDSLVNNIPILIVEGYQFRWLNIKTTHAVFENLSKVTLKWMNPCKEHIGCTQMRLLEPRQYYHRAPLTVRFNL